MVRTRGDCSRPGTQARPPERSPPRPALRPGFRRVPLGLGRPGARTWPAPPLSPVCRPQAAAEGGSGPSSWCSTATWTPAASRSQPPHGPPAARGDARDARSLGLVVKAKQNRTENRKLGCVSPRLCERTETAGLSPSHFVTPLWHLPPVPGEKCTAGDRAVT